MDSTLTRAIGAAITLATDIPFSCRKINAVNGGDINEAYISTNPTHYSHVPRHC